MMLLRAWSIVGLLWMAAPLAAGEFKFRAVELPTRLGVGYAVEAVDMNNDQKLDLVIVDQDRVIWLENPSWKEHVIIEGQTKRDNVCIAAADIDGDGRLDFALGADWTLNTERGGTIQWLQRPEQLGPRWTVHPIGEEPTVHRMQFADFDGDGRPELIVAPLLGRNTTRPLFHESGVRILSYKIPADPVRDEWQPEVINDELHVTHNILATDLTGDGQLDLVVVSFEGVSLLERDAQGKWTRTLIGEGNQATRESRGASEIKRGKLADGGDYLATIEPWHGFQVVVYTREKDQPVRSLWKRHVLDDSLKWGHAVYTANLDGDADEELVIGVRDNKEGGAPRGIRIYDPQDVAAGKWERTIIDAGGVAVEDAATADLNGDGLIDIIAVGRATHNVKIYFNETGKE